MTDHLAIYARQRVIPTSVEAERAGLAAQVARCLQYAQDRGLEPCIISERIGPADGLASMLRAHADHPEPITGVIATDPDRIWRTRAQLRAVLDLDIPIYFAHPAVRTRLESTQDRVLMRTLLAWDEQGGGIL